MNIIDINDKSVQLAEEIKTYLEKMFSSLKTTVAIAIENDKYETYVNVGGCFLVYVDFREKKTESILGTEIGKDYHYDVVAIQSNPGVYRYADGSGEPPSEDEIEICTKESTLMAACEVAKLYANMIIDGVAEGIEEERMYIDDEEYAKQMLEDSDGENS